MYMGKPVTPVSLVSSIFQVKTQMDACSVGAVVSAHSVTHLTIIVPSCLCSSLLSMALHSPIGKMAAVKVWFPGIRFKVQSSTITDMYESKGYAINPTLELSTIPHTWKAYENLESINFSWHEKCMKKSERVNVQSEKGKKHLHVYGSVCFTYTFWICIEDLWVKWEAIYTWYTSCKCKMIDR